MGLGEMGRHHVSLDVCILQDAVAERTQHWSVV